MKYIKGLNLEEKLKLKNPNKDGEADIDFVEVKPGDLKKMAKKYKLDADEYEPGMVMLKGKKKDIVGFLKDRNYDMDDQDIEGIFPELLENKEDFEPHMMYDPKTGKGYKAETYEDHLRMDKMGYVHEKPEKMDEAKKFKPGDMWSNDFDYDGMLKFALTVNEKTPIKKLNQLFDSATDVNYHTPFRNLGIAIDWIEDGDKKGAKDYIKSFHKDIKDEIKSQA